MKSACLVLSILYLTISRVTSQRVERKYMDLEDVKEIILKEVEGMKDHNKFYFSTNLFYVMCKPKIQAAIDALNLDEEDGLFYCKMIENVIPDYFLNTLMISSSENNRIINELIKEYFKVTLPNLITEDLLGT